MHVVVSKFATKKTTQKNKNHYISVLRFVKLKITLQKSSLNIIWFYDQSCASVIPGFRGRFSDVGEHRQGPLPGWYFGTKTVLETNWHAPVVFCTACLRLFPIRFGGYFIALTDVVLSWIDTHMWCFSSLMSVVFFCWIQSLSIKNVTLLANMEKYIIGFGFGFY